ncbi:GNAT family N-acetyltransferase [Pelagibius sp.]|uniref:GNAT family N-acetyltransferase n=1 Tax=Pelagibius sp. TaxID=1931238 RepID=UPI003B507EB6
MSSDGIRFSTDNPVPAGPLDGLIEAVGWGRRGEAAWAKICARSSLLVTAWEDARLVGMGRILEDGVMCMVYDVAVHPLYQGRGIGSAVMRRIVGHLERQSFQSVGLFAWDQNPVNGPFYERFGFARVGYGMKFALPAEA